MLQTLRFEGKSLDEARVNLRNATGKDVDALEVKRHGRELYGGLFGFFQKERYVIEVAPYLSDDSIHENLRPNPQINRFSNMSLRQGNKLSRQHNVSPAENKSMGSRSFDTLEHLVDKTADSVNVNFDRELQLVLNDANLLVDNQKTLAKISEFQSASDSSADIGFYRDRAPERFQATDYDNVSHTTDNDYQKHDDIVKNKPAPSQNFSEPKSNHKDLEILHDLVNLDKINAAFDTDILGLLKNIKAPATLPAKTSFVLGLIGDLDLAATAFATINEAYGNEIELIIMSDRNISRSMNALKVRSPQELGTTIIEKRLLQEKSVIIFDQKSHLDAIQKSIMVTVPDALWAVVDADYDINQVRALDLCTNGIDALMLYHIAGADNPLMMLGEKWPIAYVDGWRASKACILAKILEAKDLL